MKIAIIVYGPGYPIATGGAEIFALRLAFELSALGNTVLLLQEGPGVVVALNDRMRVEYVRNYSPRVFHGAIRFVRRLVEWRPDVVLGVSMPSAQPLTLYAKLWSRSGLVLRFAGLDLCLAYLSLGVSTDIKDPSYEWIDVYCRRAARRLRSLWKLFSVKRVVLDVYRCIERTSCKAVVLSRTMKLLYSIVFPKTPEVIPNFVDNAFYKVGLRRLEKWNWRGRRIVYVGRLTFEKGGDILAEASGIILRECRDCTITVVGDGPYRRRIEALRDEFGDRIRVTGFRPYAEVPKILENADIFIFPTRIEGCPNALLQAMAAAMPIVASSIPPNREFLSNAGLYANPDSPAEFAEQVLRLAYEEKLARRLASYAFRKAGEFRIESILARYLRVIADSF